MVKFYLDKKEGQDSPIFLSLHHHGRRFKVFTGKKIKENQWDIGSCRANSRKYKNNPVGFNKFLQDIDDDVVKLVNENKPISKADLKTIIDKASGKNVTDTFFGFAESHIKEKITNSLSVKPYLGTVNHLKNLSPALTFEDVDLNFYDKFVNYLKGEGLGINSIGGHVKRLKWIMNTSLERDKHNNVSFKKKAFTAQSEETDQIYLTRAEIQKLARKSLPPRLKKVADAFVLNCYLGMRFSDLPQIQKGNFKKENGYDFLYMVQGKTGEKIRIPVPPDAMPLIRKYKFTCPVINDKGKLISVQKFNDYLKEAAEAAEINAVEDIRSNGRVEKLPKHRLIKSHTARRSFATNLYLEGAKTQDIMAVTGHRKEQTFLLYVRADQLTKSQGLANHYKEQSKPAMKLVKGGKAA
jgi:site-specific recombinase XerD